MSDTETVIVILGLGVITLVTRAFFLWSDRDMAWPPRLQEALRHAPLAALVAVVAPEVLRPGGQWIDPWENVRLLSALAAAGAFWMWRSILLTILVGTGVMLALRLVG